MNMLGDSFPPNLSPVHTSPVEWICPKITPQLNWAHQTGQGSEYCVNIFFKMFNL